VYETLYYYCKELKYLVKSKREPLKSTRGILRQYTKSECYVRAIIIGVCPGAGTGTRRGVILNPSLVPPPVAFLFFIFRATTESHPRATGESPFRGRATHSLSLMARGLRPRQRLPLASLASADIILLISELSEVHLLGYIRLCAWG